MKAKIQSKINENQVLGWLFVAASAILFFVVYPNQIRVRANEVVSSDIFPKFCAIVMLVLGLLFLLDGYVLDKRKKLAAAQQAEEKPNAVPPLPMQSPVTSGGLLAKIPKLVWPVLFCGVYVWSMQYLGFIISTMAFLLFMLWKSGLQKWWVRLLVATIVTGVFFTIFQILMRIILPRGLILPWFTAFFQ